MFLSNVFSTPNPTLFELSMADSLSVALKPALEHLLRVLGEQYGAAFAAFQYRDEIFLALGGVLERYYLATYDGAFAENFYGMKRVRIQEQISSPRKQEPSKAYGRPLSDTEKLVSLLSLTVLPYLQIKLDTFHREQAAELDKVERQQYETQSRNAQVSLGEDAALGDDDDNESDSGNSEHSKKPSILEMAAKKAFVRIYPLLLASKEAFGLWLKIMFAFERTRFHSPTSWLLGVYLDRVTGDDIRAQMLREQTTAARSGFLGRIMSRLAGLVRTLLLGSALLYKLVEWYYSAENQSQRESAAGPAIIPPPPAPPTIRENSGVRFPRDAGSCPICHEPRKNPAVSSSGIAYCYLCINRYVSEFGRDPMTLTSCNLSQIRRIYVS